MKRKILTAAFAFFLTASAFAQTQKGNVIVGGDLSNLGLDFQDGNTTFSLNLSPKAAWFIHDNTAIGGYVNLGLTTQKGATYVSYGIGALGRKYLGDASTNLTRTTKWFLEANAGINGINTSYNGTSSNTNGLGVGFGPGLAYFVTSNVALEALAKYNLTVGFGNSTTNNNIGIGLGFQIYLGGKQVKQLAKDPMK